MHVEIANIGCELWLYQVESDVRTITRQHKIIDPNATFFAADVAPLLMLGRKRAVETSGHTVVELHLGSEFHRHWFGTSFPLQRRNTPSRDVCWHPPFIDPQDHSNGIPT